MPQVSMYAEAWNKLKTTKKCTIVADVRFHARIVKAIKKRKNEDTAYKFLCDEAGTVERLEISFGTAEKSKEIYFKLKKTRFGIGDL